MSERLQELPEYILECGECDTVLVGTFHDLWKHYLSEHPLTRLIEDEYGGITDYQLAKQLAIEETLVVEEITEEEND